MKSNRKSFDWHSFISQHPLFGELLLDEINSLLESGNSTHREFKQGNVIFRAGELSNSFFLIGKGSVNVELLSEGSSAINIDTLYKGDYFGEMSAIDNQNCRAATISANENSTLLEIKSMPFQKVLKTNPELEFKLLSMLAARLRHVNDYLLKSTHLTFDSKFALLSEKIESQSKVVDASLKASQAVFEQTKIRTDEIIHAAERGRSRITLITSTLTGVFTTLLLIFSFLGYDKLNTLEDFKKDFEQVQKDVETAQGKIEESKGKIENTKKSVDVTKEELDKKIASINDSISDSNNAKNILFESLISLFMVRVEEFIKLEAEQGDKNTVEDPSNLADHILEIRDPFITIKLFIKLFYKIVDSQLEENKLNEARINYFAYYMDQYIFIENGQQAANHLAHFLSRYILLVTDTMPEEHIEAYSERFNIQLNELETKYKQIAEVEESKNHLEKFITDTEEIEAYTKRINAVKNAIDMP